jgi:hypothetical protein
MSMQVLSAFNVLAPLTAMLIGAIGVGGGIYETLLVDRVWPSNPAVIQPNRGGINRGLFWMPVHSLYELALLVTAWILWDVASARWWLVGALAAHFAARAWSFTYFIPKALQFEKLGDLTDAQKRDAQRWTNLSRWRPMVELASVLSLSMVIVHFAAR